MAGVNDGEVPPVPIPNTEVKCSHADGSATYVCVRVGHCQASLPKNPYQFSGTGFCFSGLDDLSFVKRRSFHENSFMHRS